MLTCETGTRLTVHLKGFKGATVPASVTVARRHDKATAEVRTAVTQASRRGEIQAAFGSKHLKVALTVTRTPRSCRAPSLTSIKAPTLSYALETPLITIGLTCAPTAPIRLRLTSSNSYLRVPATVTVGRYYDYAAVPAKAGADQEGQYTGTVTVRYGRSSLSKAITVDPGLAQILISPTSGEPDAVSLNVLLTGGAPTGGLTFKLKSSSPAVTVPATYTITQPGALGVGGIPGVTVQTVSRNTPVTISATLGSRTVSASTTLLPPFDSGDSAALVPESQQGSIIYGDEYSLEYQLTLSNPAPADGLTVTYSSPSASLELQQTSGFIPAGSDDDIIDVNTAAVTSPLHTELAASVDGVTATLPITIEPGLVSITGVPATITSGDSFTATVTLAGSVDTATTVALQSLDGVLSVPGEVVIPSGSSSVTFTASTVTVTSDTSVSIEAMLGSTTVYSDSVTVTP
jgi:hypothetical protein